MNLEEKGTNYVGTKKQAMDKKMEKLDQDPQGRIGKRK